MFRCREIFSATILTATGEQERLAIRFEDLQSQEQCFLTLDTLKIVKSLIILSSTIGEKVAGVSVEDLQTGEINLTVAEVFIDAGLDKMNSFPRCPYPLNDYTPTPS